MREFSAQQNLLKTHLRIINYDHVIGNSSNGFQCLSNFEKNS